ncbi:MAG TPA: MBL fold metallo-hydrolase [Candidatus Saccharimonadales bacterium]|jgi:L-ascorbate metabolism protein UlaG (beta-lactamase superfamily)|nr:MBL fold metallo-hydrolase [Candidatus Saccharimonadales bacterium]
MELRYYGANCLVLITKQARVVVDDNLSELGGKSILKVNDIAVYTSQHSLPQKPVKLVIDGPGEYEVSEVNIQGISVRGFMDEPDQKNATLYKLLIEDIRVLITGHIFPELSDSELGSIGTVDLLCIPVGGNGYTIDGVGALGLIKKIEPKLVIPTHYAHKSLHYPIPQQSLEEALKNIAMEPKETIQRLKIKPADLLIDNTQLVIIEPISSTSDQEK